jgi:hypothetical protein
MKIAIMQPYFFPYIGYFKLIDAVDKFVIYDDVNYIKRGWINRNNILINGKSNLINLPIKNASQNKLINQTFLDINEKTVNKFSNSIEMAYSRAPFFKDVNPIIQDILNNCSNEIPISKITGMSLIKVARYLKINTVFEYSSEKYEETKGIQKEDRLIQICKKNNAHIYINSFNGKNLYSKKYFKKNNIELFFLQNQVNSYIQYNNAFIPNLSIIDVLMFNSISNIKKMILKYNLE